MENLSRFQHHRMARAWLARMTADGAPLYPELGSRVMPINDALAAELARRGVTPAGELWADVALALPFVAAEAADGA